MEASIPGGVKLTNAVNGGMKDTIVKNEDGYDGGLKAIESGDGIEDELADLGLWLGF